LTYPTVVHMLAAAAAARPEAEALVCGERRLRYREYFSAVAELASRLGRRQGERIATRLGNSIEACIAAFGVLASGAQHVPLNPLYTQAELEPILADADPSLYLTALALGPSTGEMRMPDAGALALLQYTGGTTGRAKGVNLTHRAIATNVAQRESLLPTRADGERILCVMPLFHSYAMAMALFLAANCRGTLVILERYRPETLLETMENERITIFPGSPTLFTSLMSHPRFSDADWSSVHTCYSGSAALPAETLRRWQEAVGAPVYEGYGQTEAGPVLSFNAPGRSKAGSVGISVPDTEIEIVDVETGQEVLRPGERGEIRARGPQIMQGYRNRPHETAQALRGGWLYTGDIGEIDREGFLYIRDRKKEMAIVGGYNVYPREIEEVLCAHPAVAEAAVVGGPDAYWGEVLHAYVSARGPTDEGQLLAHCRERLAKYKIPATLEIMDALPKTTVGKLDKAALKARWKSR
jgi:long-chain acyl-CoA synthetase